MKLYYGNKSTIDIAHNPIQHDKRKHSEIDRHFIKEKLEKGLVCMLCIISKQQVVDVVNKGFIMWEWRTCIP